VRNRIAPDIPTLTEILRANGYYQGATHKLHVAPVEKFPFDEFLPNPSGTVMKGFLKRATATGRPWFLLYNIPDTHRPYPNSDQVKRQKASRPAAGGGLGEPAMSPFVMRMVAPSQGHQQIDIRQGDHSPSSSRHRRIFSGSIAACSSPTSITGMPLRMVRRTPPFSETTRRNASPANCSSVFPRAVAASPSNRPSSSSIVRVVT
jgi:hypothetical protein